MTLWLILTVLLGGAAFIVLRPFTRGPAPGETPSSLDVYRDQLEEVERDRRQGQIDDAEAAAARLEIERRILAAGRSDTVAASTLSGRAQYRLVTGVVAMVALGSVGLYAAVGRPDLPSAQGGTPAAVAALPTPAPPVTQTAGAAPAEAPQGDVDALVKRLEQRLADNPNDPESWRVLGWSYYNVGRYKDGVAAYRRAVDLQKDNPMLKALLGEAMVAEAGNTVTEAALAVFAEVLAISPNDERARFFKGAARAQQGDAQGAINEWVALYKVAPVNAEWVSDLRARIEETAKQAGIDVSAQLADARPAAGATGTAAEVAAAHPPVAAAPGPTAADVESAKQLAPEDQQAMVTSMVDRLAGRLEAAPKDADGWIMLMRSRMVMKDAAKARAALERAQTVFAGEPETQQRIRQAAEAMGVAVN